MTNIIEQMYKEYGVEPVQDNIGNGLYNCHYPEFTAEKQIELIKLLSKGRNTHCISDFGIAFHPNGEYYCRFVIEEDYEEGFTCAASAGDEDFSKALAKLLIDVKPYIDNSKVKEILEG